LRPLIQKDQALNQVCEVLIDIVRDANKYIDTMEPWTLRKTDTNRMKTVLYVLMETLRHVGILYQPIIPTSANLLLDQLAVPAQERCFAHLCEEYKLKPLSPISQPKGIFPRLEGVATTKSAKQEVL